MPPDLFPTPLPGTHPGDGVVADGLVVLRRPDYTNHALHPWCLPLPQTLLRIRRTSRVRSGTYRPQVRDASAIRLTLRQRAR